MGDVIGQNLPPDVLRRAFQNKESLRGLEESSRRYMIDMGRVVLIDSHRVLRRYGDDPRVVKKYEKDYAYLETLLSPDELDEARNQAFEVIINEEE